VKITSLRASPCEMPLEDKDWKFALGAVSAARGFVVSLTTDSGHTGYGYAPSIPHMGSLFDILPKEFERLTPAVEGVGPFEIERVLQKMDALLGGASQAKGAIDLQARILGLPLHDLLGGKLRTRIPVLRILALKQPEDMARIAASLFEQGYRYFKIKVEGDLDLDVARVRAIRQRLGDEAHLTIDANQSYAAKEAILAINRMSEYRLDLVEQPVHRKDLKGLALVTQATDVTIEADEGAGTIDEILTLATNRIVDAVSLKLPKLGGIRNAVAAARICEACGIKVRLGAHVGTRLLNAHAVHVASALDVSYACELGEFMRMYDDPFKGIDVVDGHIDVPEAIGCGVTPV
jgi:L-alanine-DL-glutamate epimerase-like enolase superfamily enzyme